MDINQNYREAVKTIKEAILRKEKHQKKKLFAPASTVQPHR